MGDKKEVEITFTKIKEEPTKPGEDPGKDPGKELDYSDGLYINGVKLANNKTTKDLKISYNDLIDKPSINGKTIEGKMKTLTQLLDFQ